jgi:hypothetical protein
MTEKKQNGHPRSRIGYGSSYHRGENNAEMEKESGIGSVLGGQVWVM